MNISLRNRSGKFRRLRHFTALLPLALGLGACAAVPTHEPVAPRAVTAQPLARAQLPIPDAQHDLLAQLLAGELALTRTDLATASGFYARAMLLSDDPKVAARAAELALAVHDDGAATRALDRWQALGAKPAVLAQARAQLALDQGDAGAARRELETVLAAGDLDAWRRFGRVLLGARDQAQAARLLQALAMPEQLPAKDVKAWLAMSELGAKFGNTAYAMRVAQAAVRRFGSADAYAWEARLKFDQGDAAGSRALLAKAVAKAPRDIPLRLTYARVLAQGGKHAEAAKVLERGPQDPDTYTLRAALASAAKDNQALATLYRQLKGASDEVRTQNAFLLGQLAETQHRQGEALDWYARVDDDSPHAFAADLRTAAILHQQGHVAQAHQLLEGLQLTHLEEPKELRQAFQLDAELYLGEQKYADAEAAFGRALQVVPDDPSLLYGRGLAYAQAGNIDRAIADFRRLLELKPGDVDASNALGYTLADANRDLPEAERLIEVARKARPDDPSIADSWGWLQYRLGHLEKAEQTLRGAWGRQKDPDIGVHLGEVLASQGDLQAARQVFDAVRRIDPNNAALRAALRRLRL
jgi:tetratricopeptide (TPR) repeat protein